MSAKMATLLFAAAGLVIAPAAASAAGSYGNSNDASRGNAAATAKPGTTQLDDSAITAKIKAEFANDRDLSGSDIKVNTDQNGVVTLSGDAKSKTAADKAVSVAKKTAGVTTVKNQLTVGPGTGSTTGMTNSGSGAIGSSALGGTVDARATGGPAHKPN